MNKLNQSGRSMVEMLGVLAVIGVLSVGGIAGYRIAMTQHKANQVWNDVMTRATLVRGIPDYNSGLDEIVDKVDFASFGTTGTSGYAIDGQLNYFDEAEGAFQVEVSDVPQDVCEKVIQMRPKEEMVAIWPNGERSVKCSIGNNTMKFLFDIPQGCISLCEGWYEDWQENCGTSWSSWCDPSLGFSCYQLGYTTENCDSGFEFNCYGDYSTTDDDDWDYNRGGSVCP